ncbi:3'-5' exonuclease [Catellatospora sp. NPDC049111]|uniref:3'-5' exonuclease n=1 Tax=Catellatospora sp. NPDC049111 TaxID=3155271 RepID=UPI0033E5B7AA
MDTATRGSNHMTPEFDDLRFVVVDVEGNGQPTPEVVEIALVHLDGLTIVGEPHTWLIKPSQPITQLVTKKVHGITNADVAQAPSIEELADELLDSLGDRIPIAHNASVERKVLGVQLPEWQPPMILDTMRLAKKVWPGLGGYGLDPLLAHAQIVLADERGKRHRAGFDAYATARLFAVLAEATDARDTLFDWASLPGSTLPSRPLISQEGTLW